MTDMVERVARAICAAKFALGRPYLDEQVDRLWPNYIPQARAAIEAMLEPTEAMMYAAMNLSLDEWCYKCGACGSEKIMKGDTVRLGPAGAPKLWQAMIKEALK